MAHALLPLKLVPPPLREGVSLRPDLQALLAEVRLQPLTLVIAPAGYGKTTLLAQWAQELGRTGAPVSWLTLDVGERDPALFLAYLIRAFQTAYPALGQDATRVLSSAASPERDWPLVAGALCSDLQRHVLSATFLFLDDLHQVIDSAVIGQILGYLLRAAPPALHIVIASRREVNISPLARMRTEGRVVEVHQSDLHLTAEQARQLLAIQGVTLSDEELTTLLTRTEGWALSLQLAARALAEQPAERRSKFVAALGGGSEQLLAYLAAEVLADLPADVLEFLRLAALPPHFDADLLAHALLREDVPYLLRRIRSLGLPLTPLDAKGDRLRFHPLWRELLLRGIHEMVDDETLAAFHRRFGRQFEMRGELEEALDHYARADSIDDLERALLEHAWPLLNSPRRDTVRRWIEQIPAERRDANPELLYMWGYSQVVANPSLASQLIERAADLFRRRGAHARELRAYSDLAALLFWQARPTDFAAVCVRAIRAANQVRDAWSRGAALTCVAAMLSIRGRLSAALRVAHHAAVHPLSPAWRWLLAMIVASIHNQLGRPAEALAVVDEALQLMQIDSNDRMRQNLLRQRAMALYLLGQHTEAIALALETHRYLLDYYRDGTAGVSAAQLALLLSWQGRLDEAAIYIAQARAAFHELGALAPLASLQAIELYCMLRRGQAARAAAAASAFVRRLDEVEGAAPDLRLRLLLAVVLGEAGEHQQALDLLKTTVQQMQHRGYRVFLASACLYGAYLAGRCNNAALRDAWLRTGWAVAEEERCRFLPMLPVEALKDVAVAALRAGIKAEAVGRILPRHLDEEAVEMFQDVLNDPLPEVRAQAARLLGDVGAAVAYPALRTLLKDRNATVRQIAEESLNRLVYRPPYTLRIRMLGAFAVWRGDHEIRDREWRSSKARQLLQLLLTERGRALPRERVVEALWPDMEIDAATNNLRVTINRLSKALEPDRPDGAPSAYLIQQGETYAFNTASDHQIDVVEFIEAINEGRRADQRGQRAAAIAAYRRAIQLYGGPYLPDNMYEDWTVVERERLALAFIEAALRLGALLLDEGAIHEAIGLGWRVIEIDQTQEEAYRLLMRAHAALGERSTALRLYARCVNVLQQELGIAPLPETTALYHMLRDLR
ncbi:MAG: HEAT repeat domain-containing protein [Roseiflexus sp.]|nr:HEAT repeat domain-containing protein [Roseiflexus sp.]MCS7289215.1 HEAT repeat domain-containing protein [Roseiflexus sp.]MDW8232629.1 BTAD domain-containing putative transcriptional regulator [Roseiflexaceae bacterium]